MSDELHRTPPVDALKEFDEQVRKNTQVDWQAIDDLDELLSTIQAIPASALNMWDINAWQRRRDEIIHGPVARLYPDLVEQLLGHSPYPAPLPLTGAPAQRRNPGDLSEADDTAIHVACCEVMPALSREAWHAMTAEERLPLMEATVERRRRPQEKDSRTRTENPTDAQRTAVFGLLADEPTLKRDAIGDRLRAKGIGISNAAISKFMKEFRSRDQSSS